MKSSTIFALLALLLNHSVANAEGIFDTSSDVSCPHGYYPQGSVDTGLLCISRHPLKVLVFDRSAGRFRTYKGECNFMGDLGGC